MTGSEVRAMILDSGVRLWQVADGLGVTDNSFSRRLRKDFTEAEVDRIKSIIADLQAKQKTA